MTPPNYPPQQPNPYGPPAYQPPPGQEWGQQQPNPYGPPQQQGGFPPPNPYGAAPMPAPPKKSGKGVLLGCGLALVLVVGLAIWGVASLWGTGAGGAKAGDCIKVNSAKVNDADVERIDCGSSDAAFKVAQNLSSSTDRCPEGDYAEYRSTGRRSNGFKLCLMLNAKEGDCFKEEGTVIAGKTTKVTCSSSATYKVTKVVSKVDKSACADDEEYSTYADPATTLCLAKP